MSVLKITERKTDWLDKDPYDLFELAESPRADRSKAEFYGAVVVGALIAAVISLAIVWSFYRAEQEDQIQPYAYLEVKAIDPEGRPVVGALVKTDGEPAGVTDAFGEWRRFMRVPLGGRVALTMMKKAEAGMMSSVKTLKVPDIMPETGDIEVVDRIQLTYLDLPEGLKKDLTDRPPTVTTSEAKVEETIPSPAKQLDASTHLIYEQDEPMLGIQTTPKNFDRVWIVAEDYGSSLPASGEVTATFLHKQVVVALRQRARQLGLIVDPNAKWRVSMRHLAVKGSPGLIQTKATYQSASGDHEDKLYAFLANYTGDPMDTARAIMFRISQHTPAESTAYTENGFWYLPKAVSPLWHRNPGTLVVADDGEMFRIAAEKRGHDHALDTRKGAPCGASVCRVRTLTVPHGSPNPGWEMLPLRLHGAQGRRSEVFVAGIGALQTSPGIYSFWGTPGQPMNLTVVADGQVIHREKITASRSQGAQVSLSVGTISRR